MSEKELGDFKINSSNFNNNNISINNKSPPHTNKLPIKPIPTKSDINSIIPGKNLRRLSNDQISMASENSKRTIFKTIPGGEDEMRKMMKLMKNRLSARKCRQKKKTYIQLLEGDIEDLKKELEKYKHVYKKEKQMENVISLVNKYIDVYIL
jgi:hypothetical protein